MFDNLKIDISRYLGKDQQKISFQEFVYFLFDQGFWAVLAYRFNRALHQTHIPIISFVLKLIGFFAFKSIEISTGISIPASAEIGPGFYIGHFGGIIIHSEVKAGKNLSIGTGVVIGTKGLGREGAPILGDDIYIGVGAKVLGKIKIGNNVRIGANAVVVEDIPDGATVVGIPAQIVRKG